MSGHSKWAQIKHKKALTDSKKAKIFSKIARAITIVAKEKGSDPSKNASLRLAIEKAKAVNMSSDNIERAIKKGSGEGSGNTLETVKYEAYGPAGSAFIIEAITDNKNRTTSEIKHILSKHGGRLAEPGSVEWLFEKKGVIEILYETLEQKAEIELAAIDSGAIDIDSHDNSMDIYTTPEDLEPIKESLKNKNLKIESSSINFISKNLISISEDDYKKIENLFDALDEHDDAQEIYSNIKNSQISI